MCSAVFLAQEHSVTTDCGRGESVRCNELPCPPMRTTLEIDAAVLAAAKEIARTRRQTLGEVISELARKGLESDRQAGEREHAAFPVFDVPPDAEVLTVQSVQAIIDYEGLSARR
jgi:hypothetical protein